MPHSRSSAKFSARPAASFKERLARVLENKVFEGVLLLFIVADIVLLLIEEGIDSQFLCFGGQTVALPDHQSQASWWSSWFCGSGSCPALQPVSHGTAHTAVLVCDVALGHHVAHSCHLCSLTILVATCIEMLLKFWVGPAAFLQNGFLVFESMIIIVSLSVDTLLVSWIEDRGEKIADRPYVHAAVMFVRLWRVIRIGYGFVEGIHDITEEAEKEAEKGVKNRLISLEFELSRYKAVCKEHEIILESASIDGNSRDGSPRRSKDPVDRGFT